MTSQSLSLPITIPTSGLSMCYLIQWRPIFSPTMPATISPMNSRRSDLARFVEQNHADDGGTDGTNAGPDGIAGAERDLLECELRAARC